MNPFPKQCFSRLQGAKMKRYKRLRGETKKRGSWDLPDVTERLPRAAKYFGKISVAKPFAGSVRIFDPFRIDLKNTCWFYLGARPRGSHMHSFGMSRHCICGLAMS